MSTATFERPLYAVPNVPPSTKARFASLLALRDAAYRAFDKALSLPRSAMRWAIDLFHRWVEATGSVGVLSWLSAQVRNAAGLFRTAGVVPSALAVLSTPSITAAAVRVAKLAGRGLLRVASAAWTRLKALLGRCGNTGTRVAEGLGRAGTYVADAVTTLPNTRSWFRLPRHSRPRWHWCVRSAGALSPTDCSGPWSRSSGCEPWLSFWSCPSWWTLAWPAASGTPCGLHAPTRRTAMSQAMVCSLTS